MKHIPRALEARVLQLSRYFPVVVISGARQVGKSTLLRSILTDRRTGADGSTTTSSGEEPGRPVADFVTFDPVLDIEGARADPDLFIASHRRPLVLDEIQYAPEVASAVKRAVDRDRQPGSFFISGSQQWAVMKGLSDSLAGRAVFLDLEAFSVAELAGASLWLGAWLESERLDPTGFRADAGLPLPERLWRGWMPETQELPLDLVPDFHAAYLRTYIERDARTFSAPQDLQSFGTFVRLAASLTAQEFNASSMARELGISAPTATRWRDILAATFQHSTIPAFAANPVTRIRSKPKSMMREIGLAVHLLGLAGPASVANSTLRGRLFETLVAGEIRKAASLLRPVPHIHHWRSAGGAEVDLVLEWNGRLYPMEIKLASTPTRRDTSGLAAFRAANPSLDIAPSLVIAACDHPYPLAPDCHAVPWDWCTPRMPSASP